VIGDFHGMKLVLKRRKSKKFYLIGHGVCLLYEIRQEKEVLSSSGTKTKI
jgi:hypothetical protein